MAFSKGTVERFSAKEIPKDKYGNTYRLSVKIGDTWYGLGAGKTSDINVKDGKEFRKLELGDEVEFRYTSREHDGKTYFDTKRTDITVVKPAGTVPAKEPVQSSRTSPAPTSVGTTKVFTRTDIGIKVGHAINAAIQIIGETAPDIGKDVYFKTLEEYAWEVAKLSEKMNSEFETVLNGAKQTEAEKNVPAETTKVSTSPVAAGPISSKPAPTKAAPATAKSSLPVSSVTEEDDAPF